MKHRHVVLVGALVAVMSASAVFAGEAGSEVSGGLLEALFGEGGPLNEVLPEGTDINAMVDTAIEQLNQADSEIGAVLGEIYDMAQQEAGNISPEAVKDFANDRLGQFLGGGEEEEEEFDFSSLGAYLEVIDNYRAEEEQYIKDKNADMMDPGDVQIVSAYPIATADFELDSAEITNLASMIQGNYKLDDENQLLFVSGASDVVLFRHEKNEEGIYAVADATFAEDGENYTPSIEKMCEEMGITIDEFFSELAYAEAAVAYDLEEYLNNNPDIKGIEYMGEVRTAEELNDIYFAALDEIYPTEEEAVTEDAGSLE